MKINCPPPLKELAQKSGKPLYIVGGYVRNTLCGLSTGSADIDICGAFDADEFSACGARVVTVNKKLGTALVTYRGESYEYTRFRTESYPRPGVHSPDRVEFSASLGDDAKRRDFTVNSLYYDVKNDGLIDPLGGLPDIKLRRIRAADPAAIFRDDGLRLMRLARFGAELGFGIEQNTKDAAIQYRQNLKEIAAERKQAELNKILSADLKYGVRDAHYHGLKHLTELRLWEFILPSLVGADIAQNPKYHKHNVLEHTLLAVKYAPPEVRLAALMHDTGKPVAVKRDGNMHNHAEYSAEISRRELGKQGLKYPNDITDEVAELCLLHMYDLNQKTSEGKMRLFVAQNYLLIDKLQALAEADGMATGQENLYVPRFREFKLKMQEENTPFTLAELKIDGRDAIAAGYEGAAIRQVLEELWRECVLNPRLNDRDWLLSQLKIKSRIY